MKNNSRKKKFNKETIQSWPDILEDIDIHSIPVEYVKQIKVNFLDGREWIIDMDENPQADIDTAIEELYKEYEDVIDSINFNVDIDKIKAEIEKRTTIFLKKRK